MVEWLVVFLLGLFFGLLVSKIRIVDHFLNPKNADVLNLLLSIEQQNKILVTNFRAIQSMGAGRKWIEAEDSRSSKLSASKDAPDTRYLSASGLSSHRISSPKGNDERGRNRSKSERKEAWEPRSPRRSPNAQGSETPSFLSPNRSDRPEKGDKSSVAKDKPDKENAGKGKRSRHGLSKRQKIDTKRLTQKFQEKIETLEEENEDEQTKSVLRKTIKMNRSASFGDLSSIITPLISNTAEEEAALQLMKETISDIYDKNNCHMCDQNLLRFLRARGFDIPKASQLFVNQMKWRQEYRPDLISPEEVSEEITKRKAFLHGFDKAGNVLICVFPFRHNPRERDFNVFTKFIVYFFENTIKHMKPGGGDKVSLIIDYEGYSTKNSDFALTREILPMVLQMYPERVHAVYLINYSWALYGLYRLAKPFLDPRTTQQVSFFDNKEKLQEYVDHCYLLQKHGGKSTFAPTGLSIGLETLSDSFIR